MWDGCLGAKDCLLSQDVNEPRLSKAWEIHAMYYETLYPIIGAQDPWSVL